MKCDVIRSVEADLLLADERFRTEWSQLYGKCPWATPFQSSVFACTWYETYRKQFEPLIVLSRDDRGGLQGLLLLAISCSGKQLVVAGGHQAEYQAWICLPEFGDAFVSEAIRTVTGEFPSREFSFQYLPRKVPTCWLEMPKSNRICRLSVHRRPLMRFGDGKSIEESLKKSGNKSRLRQLRKLGKIEFKRLHNPSELEECFDEIIAFYDLRRLAVSGWAPFGDDRLKKAFHLALLKSPELLHVTVLKVGARIASAHINVVGNNEISLWLIAHNPLLARYSPGKLHILFLAQMLLKEGYKQLDLTPGGEPYKDRFANAWDKVSGLMVFPTPQAKRKAAIHVAVKNFARQVLNITRTTSGQARSYVHRIKRIHQPGILGTLVHRAMAWAGFRQRVRVYEYKAERLRDIETSDMVRRNALDDLLAYHASETGMSRSEFLSAALYCIEDGQHLYTCVGNGRLQHYGWLIDHPVDGLIRRLLPGFKLPPNSALIIDGLNLSETSGQGLSGHCLRKMLRDAAHLPGVESVFLVVAAANVQARPVFGRVGLTSERILCRTAWIGWSRRWRDILEPSDQRPNPGMNHAAGEFLGASI